MNPFYHFNCSFKSNLDNIFETPNIMAPNIIANPIPTPNQAHQLKALATNNPIFTNTNSLNIYKHPKLNGIDRIKDNNQHGINILNILMAFCKLENPNTFSNAINLIKSLIIITLNVNNTTTDKTDNKDTVIISRVTTVPVISLNVVNVVCIEFGATIIELNATLP